MRQFQIVTAALALGIAAGMLGLASHYQILACVTAPIGFALGGLSMMVIHRIKDAFKK